MTKVMDVRVVTPERTVFEGAARSLVAPAWDGSVGVLPGHAPFLTLIGAGPIRIESPEPEGSASFDVRGGVMKVEADAVTVLADRLGENATTTRESDAEA